MSGTVKDKESDSDAVNIERRVDRVIDDLTKGLIAPRKVDAIGDAVNIAKRNRSLNRAVGRSSR